MDTETYRRMTIAQLRGRKVRTLRTLNRAWAVVPSGSLMSVEGIGTAAVELLSDLCPMCNVQVRLHDRKTTDGLRPGSRVRTSSTHEHGTTAIPAGYVLTVERKWNGLTLRGDTCSACGINVWADRVRGTDVDLIEEDGKRMAEVCVANYKDTTQAECLDCEDVEFRTVGRELDIAMRHVRETGHHVVVVHETTYNVMLSK